MTPDDDELVEKVRGLMAPAREGDSWLDRTLHSADTSAQLAEMKHEMARVILVQSAEIARLREAMQEIETWSRAYPLVVFPEPNFKKAAEVLKAAGMTLDAISASNMRHVVEGVGAIARAALETKG